MRRDGEITSYLIKTKHTPSSSISSPTAKSSAFSLILFIFYFLAIENVLNNVNVNIVLFAIIK